MTEKPEAVNLINNYLKVRGIRKNWFADQIGVRNASLSRWLSGKWTPSPMARKRIADLTNGEVPETSWR